MLCIGAALCPAYAAVQMLKGDKQQAPNAAQFMRTCAADGCPESTGIYFRSMMPVL